MNISQENKEKTKKLKASVLNSVTVILSAVAVGLLCGAVGGAFAKSISFVTALRTEHNWLIFILPLGGIVSVALYKLTKNEGIGTDRALETVRGDSQMPVLLMPVIFVASVITHLFGGSAGKEGAALQIGSSVAELISKLTKADKNTRSVLSICGMSALFSAVFGTPVGACVFALEVAVIGKINASAILPAFVSSVAAFFVSTAMGVVPESFHIDSVPDFGFLPLLKTAVITLAVSVMAGLFCKSLCGSKKLAEKLFKNPFVRIAAGGLAVIALTMIFGTDYNGGGMFVVERIFEEGTVKPEAFLLKFVFTVITVSAGYKGGEIVPSFFIGATLGAAMALVLGLPIGFCAAIGMTAFFGAATNCQLASAVIAAELFGAEAIVFFAVAAFASRLVFRKTSLYQNKIQICIFNKKSEL